MGRAVTDAGSAVCFQMVHDSSFLGRSYLQTWIKIPYFAIYCLQ
jgi:hypothetical protein